MTTVAPSALAWFAHVRDGSFIADVHVANAHGVVLESMYVSERPDHWQLCGNLIDSDHNVIGQGDTMLFAWMDFCDRFSKIGMCKDCRRLVFDMPNRPNNPCLPCQVRASLVAEKLCAVCHETSAKHYTLLCGHSGCRACLTQWAVRTCPECRAKYGMNAGWREMKAVEEEQ